LFDYFITSQVQSLNSYHVKKIDYYNIDIRSFYRRLAEDS